MVIVEQKPSFNFRQMFIWLGAMLIGCGLGLMKLEWLNEFFDFVASAYTSLFKFVAVPTIALAITTTLATMGGSKNATKIFIRALLIVKSVSFSLVLTIIVKFKSLFFK
jgi:Na+/H+-dicarboxylate symporter